LLDTTRALARSCLRTHPHSYTHPHTYTHSHTLTHTYTYTHTRQAARDRLLHAVSL